MKTLEQLRAALKKAVDALTDFENNLVDDAGEPRDATEDEVKKHGDLIKKVELLSEQVTNLEKSSRFRAETAPAADPDGGRVPAEPKDEKKFKSFGQFLSAVAADGMNKGDTSVRDPRLNYERIITRAAGANEAVPSEGGFLVQSDHSTEMLDLMHEMGEILRRVRRIGIGSNANGINLPAVDEDSRQRGSRFGGVRAYWAGEGETVTDSKPSFREIELKLKKLMGIGYATEEILQDAAVLESIMKRAFVEEMTFEAEDAVVNGSGAGKPLGYLNSGALITVPAQSGQASGTIMTQNILDMWDRLPTRSRRNAAWLVADNQVETSLYTLTLPGSGAHIYRPPGMNDATPGNEVFGRLLNRPVIPVEYLPTLGTAGDICLVDLNEYVMVDKGGVQESQSMHVRFLYDEMTFKITYRADGQPAWKKPITPANGGNTKSPFITLAAR